MYDITGPGWAGGGKRARGARDSASGAISSLALSRFPVLYVFPEKE